MMMPMASGPLGTRMVKPLVPPTSATTVNSEKPTAIVAMMERVRSMG